jgi:hypothetical protein
LNLFIKEGCPGVIVSVDPMVAQMRYTYSGWHLFIYIVDAYLAAGDGDSRESPSVDVVLCILNLYLAYFKSCGRVGFELFLDHCADAGVERTHAISSVTRLLGRCCVGAEGMEMMTVCIEVVGVCMVAYADVVWTHLKRETTLFPRYVITTGGGVHAEDGGSYLQSVVMPVEKQRGVYPCLIAFLGLVRKMVGVLVADESDGGRRDVVLSCVVFVHAEVFTSFGGWRYHDLKVSCWS